MKKQFAIYRLYFNAPLHINSSRADGRVSETTIQSDTFYAALTSCLISLGEDLGDTGGNLGFVISSLFPFFQEQNINGGKPIYFLPMPLQTTLPQLKDVSKAKDVKRVRWVAADLYATILDGTKIFDNESMVDKIRGPFLTEAKLPEGTKNFIKSQVVQRLVMKDRTGRGDVLPFYFDRITFQDQSGLYFMVEFTDNDAKSKERFERALALLSQEGIGSDRSVGYGHFSYKSDSLELFLPDKADHQLSLSVLIPADGDQLKGLLEGDRVAYSFVRRGGWITTEGERTLRKNPIYAFLPGSVFHSVGDSPGTIVDLQPTTMGHPVWRFGKAITLPIILPS
ncbi:MAG: type III-A CRISPR-associated RAMP protein Csm4 [Prevotella sp.]|nr:type III-A CRISPR-associated RAMP protein Csm4 [Prevotella sp.]